MGAGKEKRQFYDLLPVIAFVLTAPFAANAGGFYVETGFGLSRIQSGSDFFGGGLPASPSMGAAFTFGLVQNFSRVYAPVQFHFGLKGVVASSSGNGDSYYMLAPYPLLRFEISRFYFGGGVTPFYWGSQGGLGGISQVSGALGGYGEAGLLWRVTPFFNLALEGSVQVVKVSNGLSPKPAIAGILQMRFYMFYGESKGGSKRKFDGWRYPFGTELFD